MSNLTYRELLEFIKEKGLKVEKDPENDFRYKILNKNKVYSCIYCHNSRLDDCVSKDYLKDIRTKIDSLLRT